MLTLPSVGEAEAHNNLRDMQEEIMDTMTVAAARQQQNHALAQAQAAMLALPPVAARRNTSPHVDARRRRASPRVAARCRPSPPMAVG